MPEETRTLQVGDARVTLLNAGNMRLLLSAELAVPEALWRPQYADLFERPGVCPSLSIYVELQSDKVLVDINDYLATVTADSPYALSDYTPPPPIPVQLAKLGVQPEDVTHVVITHAHWDHYAGVTAPADGAYAPTFPRARYALGAADWRDAEFQTALQDPTSLEARSLGVIRERGMLHLVEGPEHMAEGIDILPAPGETPGHQIVRVQSEGETLFIVGDVIHHVHRGGAPRLDGGVGRCGDHAGDTTLAVPDGARRPCAADRGPHRRSRPHRARRRSFALARCLSLRPPSAMKMDHTYFAMPTTQP